MSGAVEGALLPCPFCGGTDGDLVETFTRATDTLMIWAVECERCGAERASDASEHEAREFWNTRTTPPARSYADGVEDAARIVEHGYRCSTCAAIFIDTPSDTLNGGHPDNGCAFPNWYRLTEEEQAEAIRLLSQGGKA